MDAIMGISHPFGLCTTEYLEVKIMRRYGLLVLLIFFLVSCGDSRPSLEDLGKTEWKLISLNNQDTVPGTTATLNFYEDNLNGTTGCNVYRAGFTLKGKDISIFEMILTEQYCEEPPGIMEQEKIYTEILGNATRILVEQGQLMLLTEDELFLLFAE
jgi:heat shock protein HslJ